MPNNRHVLDRTGPSPTERGYWQEKITWDCINSTITAELGIEGLSQQVHSNGVNQKLTWTKETSTVVLTWFVPNTHPVPAVGVISRPEFDLAINGHRYLNVESKNFKMDYLPFSTYRFNAQVIERFRYMPADMNILVISEWRMQPGDTEQIQQLLGTWNIKRVITNRQAESTVDQQSYNSIKTQLEPIIVKLLRKP
jgi:hypothetical protein